MVVSKFGRGQNPNSKRKRTRGSSKGWGDKKKKRVPTENLDRPETDAKAAMKLMAAGREEVLGQAICGLPMRDTLHKVGRKTVAQLGLQHLALHCFYNRAAAGYDLKQCAKLAAEIFAVAPATVLKWHYEWDLDMGGATLQLLLKRESRAVRTMITNSDDAARAWLQAWAENNKNNKKRKLHASDFQTWVNEILLRDVLEAEKAEAAAAGVAAADGGTEPAMEDEEERPGLKAGLSRGKRVKPGTPVSLTTCTTWMRRLGWTCMDYQKGEYFDGHNKAEVLAARELYLKD